MANMDAGADRPFKYSGKIRFDVPGITSPLSVDYVSGGANRGSAPFGDYPITAYVPKTPHGLQGFALNDAGGNMPDPKYPNAPRSDIMLHLDPRGRTLDKLRSSGCLSVPEDQWPALRDQIVSLQNQGYKLVAHLAPDGNVTIGPASGATSGNTVPANDFIAYTNQTRSGIQSLQTTLAKAGFNPGKIDGISGPQTVAALKAFQQTNGLTPDGIVGPMTSTVLASYAGRPTDFGSWSTMAQANMSDAAVTSPPIPRPLSATKPLPAPAQPVKSGFDIPGILNVSRELALQPDKSGHYPTMASGYIHRAIANAPKPDMAAAGASLKATGASIAAPITTAFQGLGSTLGGLFSPKSPPVPPLPIPTATPTQAQMQAMRAVPTTSYQAPPAPMTPPLAPGLTAAQKYAMSAVPASAYMAPAIPTQVMPQITPPQMGTPPGTQLRLTTSRPSPPPPPIMALLASGNRAPVGATTPHGGTVQNNGSIAFNWGSVPGPGQPKKWWQTQSSGDFDAYGNSLVG